MTTISSLYANITVATASSLLTSARATYGELASGTTGFDTIEISDTTRMLFEVHKSLSLMQMFAFASVDKSDEIATLQEMTEPGFDTFVQVPEPNVVIFGSSTAANQKYETYDNLRAWTGSGVSHVSGGEGSEVFSGAGDDSVSVGHNSLVDAEDGNDSIVAGSNAIVVGGAGNDTISAEDASVVYGGDGDDAITAFNGSTIEAGSGDDTITAEGSTAYGGAGADSISAGGGGIVSGGLGDDSVTLTGGGVDIRFDAEHGSDTIEGGQASTIKLGSALTSHSLRVEVIGDDLSLSFDGRAETITYRNYRGSNPRLEFADGSVIELQFG
ncbi:hypothetical protein [Chthonobacter albigriseus]|uniref:hypothetical protein n=1 Tax=Chthonobacter albigriseus TaxID=1683161 RepID=UPI0015EEA959|nr:hypothetical protein [Chthonobacter albigriseus]